jgi:hypothetical protein
VTPARSAIASAHTGRRSTCSSPKARLTAPAAPGRAGARPIADVVPAADEQEQSEQVANLAAPLRDLRQRRIGGARRSGLSHRGICGRPAHGRNPLHSHVIRNRRMTASLRIPRYLRYRVGTLARTVSGGRVRRLEALTLWPVETRTASDWRHRDAGDSLLTILLCVPVGEVGAEPGSGAPRVGRPFVLLRSHTARACGSRCRAAGRTALSRVRVRACPIAPLTLSWASTAARHRRRTRRARRVRGAARPGRPRRGRSVPGRESS